MSRFCDRENPNTIARSETALNAKRIPTIVGLADRQNFLENNIAVVGSANADTDRFLGNMIKCLIMYQGIDYALQRSTSQAFHRLASPIRTNNNINARPDIWKDAACNLGIVKKEDQGQLEAFCASIIKLCLDLGMHVDDIPKITIVSLLFGTSAGIGVHGDSPTAADKDDLSCRIVIRYGGPQVIRFAGYTCTESETIARKKDHNLSFDIHSTQGTMAYFTTPFSNGKLMMCWTDDDKKVGIQAKHWVTKIGPQDMHAANFVIDFPLRSLRAVKNALATFRGMKELKLDFPAI